MKLNGSRYFKEGYEAGRMCRSECPYEDKESVRAREWAEGFKDFISDEDYVNKWKEDERNATDEYWEAVTFCIEDDKKGFTPCALDNPYTLYPGSLESENWRKGYSHWHRYKKPSGPLERLWRYIGL